MAIKGKGLDGPRIPARGDSTPPSSATRAAPTRETEEAKVDAFEDTTSSRTFSGESDGRAVQLDARPSAKRNFSKLLAQTENKLAREHRELQAEVRAVLAQLHEGDTKIADLGDELSPLRSRLSRIRRRLATLRRRHSHLGLTPRDFQADLRPGLSQLESTQSKISHLSQLRRGGVEMFDAPEDAVGGGDAFARGARSERVSRFLLETLTGEALETGAKSDLDHPRADELLALDAALRR